MDEAVASFTICSQRFYLYNVSIYLSVTQFSVKFDNVKAMTEGIPSPVMQLYM